MQDVRTFVKKLAQLAALTYLLACVVYTTVYFIVSPVSFLYSGISSSDIRPWPIRGRTSLNIPGKFAQRRPIIAPRVDLIAHTLDMKEPPDGNPGSGSATGWLASLPVSDNMLHWPNPAAGENAMTSIREETFLSRAFAGSMHPTKIIPFFYRASGQIGEGDVTITTLVTSNRFKVLKKLVERYQGPISVAIHIPLPPAVFEDYSSQRQFINAVKNLETLYASSPYFAAYVDVHLALSPLSVTTSSDSSRPETGTSESDRQFNVWRNVARLFARTEFVMMLDVDFAVCTDWRDTIREAIHRYEDSASLLSLSPAISVRLPANTSMDPTVFAQLRAGQIALVIPAFEYVKQEDGMDQSTFPQDKQRLLALISSSPPKITSFHSSWAPGHNSTDYPKYLALAPGSGAIYQVTTYQSAYEPYVITSKRVSWCDERFTGYGANKAACLFEMYLSGVSFWVMADHFLIHQSHRYEEEARREERKYNRKLYADFKEEACLRYLYKFHVEGALHTPLAYNALEECRKIKSVARLATELIGEDIGRIKIREAEDQRGT